MFLYVCNVRNGADVKLSIMFELALKTIEEKIKQEKSTRDFFFKEIKKYQEYHSEQILKIEELQKEYDKLKAVLNKETA